jgi:SAM-dependent methyltransferase
MEEAGDANRRWAEMLARWAIPEALVAAAPVPPYFFDPKVFIDAADEALNRDRDTISDGVAREALPAGGSVLDVGAGAGAASLRLRPARAIGVDPSRALLDAFAERAARLGIQNVEVEGTWPAVAAQTPEADVAVCHHVVYNVADLAAFASALNDHATQRVVVELTAVHPMAWMTPYWEALHGLPQPDRPTADDAVAVLSELGLNVHQQRWARRVQMIGEDGPDQLARIARRLCLPEARYQELRQLLAITPPSSDRDMVTLWW